MSGDNNLASGLVIYLDPAGQQARDAIDYDLRADLGAAPHLAVVSNGFPDSDRFRDILGATLRAKVPGAEMTLFERVDPEASYSDEELATLNDCAAVALVFGHCGGCTAGTARDAQALTELGIPNVPVITANFWSMFEALIDRSGIVAQPAVEVPFPMQGRSDEEFQEIADRIVPEIVALWQGSSTAPARWQAVA